MLACVALASIGLAGCETRSLHLSDRAYGYVPPPITAQNLSGSCAKDGERLVASYPVPSAEVFFKVAYKECKTGDLIVFPADAPTFAAMCNPALPIARSGYRIVTCYRDNDRTVNARIHQVVRSMHEGTR